MSQRFDSALYSVARELRIILQRLPENIKITASEIRLRKGCPLAVTVGGRVRFVTLGGDLQDYLSNGLVIVDERDINESFRLLCANSAFAHEQELKEGFVAMKNGCRAGVCGTMTQSGFMRDITSINIRIAREIKGCANAIAETYNGGGLLIAGAPCSGKTTVLRELVRKLSCGECGKFYRVTVIDSRLELSGGGYCDLGACCDLLVTSDRAKGCEIAVRTMFPDIIAFDEIGTENELLRITESFFAGVSVITTAHAGSVDELMHRNVTARIIKSGVIEKIALLPLDFSQNIRLISPMELTYDNLS